MVKKKQKRDWKRFWTEMNPQTKTNILKFTGLAIAAFALFTLVCVISYLMTWSQDQSLSITSVYKEAKLIKNTGNYFGYNWSRFLVQDCFGLGSFALVVLLGFYAWKLFFRNSQLGIVRITLLSISGSVISSALLAAVSIVTKTTNCFGGGLGGYAGNVIVSFLHSIGGYWTVGIVLVLCSIVWLLCASKAFSRWFSRIGEKKDKAEVSENEEIAVDSTREDAQVEGQTNEGQTNEGETNEGAMEEVIEGEANESEAEEGVGTINELGTGQESAEGLEVVASEGGEGMKAEDKIEGGNTSEGLEVVMHDNINTQVYEELPRIDIREELERYEFPPLDLLKDYSQMKHEVSKQELDTNNNLIRATLLNYKVKVDKVTAVLGPTVTLYKVVPAPGVKVATIENLNREIAMALGTKGVRIVQLPDSVGIEVPNSKPSIVPLKAMLNSEEYRTSKAELPVAIGYTITQKVKTFDLADAPHLLVAGATKQGKSVGLNVIISSLLYSKHPSELKFVFVDPKMVEFTAYKSLLKHYLAVLPTATSEEDEAENAIITNPGQAELVLNSLCIEMDERYKLLKLAGVNDLKLYNEKYRNRHLLPTEGHKYLPYIVVVIDEYADLTMSGGNTPEGRKAAKQIETSIIRLAQKGRAAGIHVIIATQRPTVNVVTGLIKSNFPARIAFRVSARVDSSTILDTTGAENLIGKGDMLYYAEADIVRVQCAYVSMDEIHRITDFISSQKGWKQCYNTPYYLPVPESQDGEPGGGSLDMQNIDPMFEDAANLVVSTQKGSTSDLQRRLGMGYARAGRVMDQLEGAGIVGPQEGSKPRKVLVTFEELQDILREIVK